MPDTLAAMLASINDGGANTAAEMRAVIEALYELDLGTPPVDGDFAWVNQGSSVVNVNSRGHISLIAPHNAAGSLSCRVKTAPATPYTITARVGYGIAPKDFHGVGLIFRESGTGEILTFGPAWSTGEKLTVNLWASPTSFGSTKLALGSGRPEWLRLADNGTNRIYSISGDGLNWVDVFSHGRTVDTTSDQVGFFANAQNGSVPNLSTQIVIKSWDEA